MNKTTKKVLIGLGVGILAIVVYRQYKQRQPVSPKVTPMDEVSRAQLDSGDETKV